MDPWTDRLSDYLDDELAAGERQSLEHHLHDCDACRAVLSDLRAIVERAAKLQHRAPASDLWPEIEGRLATIGPARRTFTFSLPQLAAAAVLLMALSGGLVWLARAPARQASGTAPAEEPGRRTPPTALPIHFADQSYDQAVADLQRTLAAERGRLDPSTIGVIERNLATIDAAIAQAQRALEADPSNTYLNGHLADARRRKLALLRSVSAMTDPEG